MHETVVYRHLRALEGVTISFVRRDDNHEIDFLKDALRKPEIIAREIVGMLNAEGGEVWIGIGDDSDGVGSELPE